MAAPASGILMKKHLILQKTLLYYRKFYYMKNIFSTKLVSIKIPFIIRKSTIFVTILILIDVLEYK